MINILIAAPAPMMRAGLRAMLDSADLQVVGEIASLGEIATRGESVDVVVLADADLLAERAPGWPGEPAPALVVLVDSDWPIKQLVTLPLRGWAVLPVEAAADELRAAVSAAAEGLVVLPNALARRLLAPQNPLVLTETSAPLDTLTPRELEVLQLLSDGLSNKLLARRLNISEHTVKFHVSSIYNKLGAVSRADAVSRGARTGLITL